RQHKMIYFGTSTSLKQIMFFYGLLIAVINSDFETINKLFFYPIFRFSLRQVQILGTDNKILTLGYGGQSMSRAYGPDFFSFILRHFYYLANFSQPLIIIPIPTIFNGAKISHMTIARNKKF